MTHTNFSFFNSYFSSKKNYRYDDIMKKCANKFFFFAGDIN